MIKPETFYMVICDNCDTPLIDDTICAWSDERGAKETATNSEWHFADGGKCYCPNCYAINDNDEVEIINKTKL